MIWIIMIHHISCIKKTMALVLAGGRGSRLYNLTDTRAKLAYILGANLELLILLYQIV